MFARNLSRNPEKQIVSGWKSRQKEGEGVGSKEMEPDGTCKAIEGNTRHCEASQGNAKNSMAMQSKALHSKAFHFDNLWGGWAQKSGRESKWCDRICPVDWQSSSSRFSGGRTKDRVRAKNPKAIAQQMWFLSKLARDKYQVGQATKLKIPSELTDDSVFGSVTMGTKTSSHCGLTEFEAELALEE